MKRKEQSIPADSQPSDIRMVAGNAIKDMLYISESEAPLELMAWRDVADKASLQEKIAAEMKVSIDKQTVITTEDFLNGIHAMADPADAAMLQYAKSWDTLFELLKTDSKEMFIILADGAEHHIFIADFAKDGAVIIHTTAVET